MAQNCCRLCLNNSEILIDIFDEPYKDNNFQLKIHELFKFLVNRTDMVKSICMLCTSRIGDFYSFFELVKQTQLKLIEKNVLKEDLFSEVTRNSTNINQMSEKVRIDEKLENEILQVVKDEKNYNDEMSIPEILLGDSYKDEINDRDYSIQKAENIDYIHSSELSPHFYENDPDSDDNLLTYKNVLRNSIQSNVSKHKKVKKIKEKRVYKKLGEQPNFPVELLKDGKMLMKGPPLDALINKFYNLQCTSCPNLQKFERISKLMKHFENVHKTRGHVTCYCNTSLYNHRSVYLHMAKHLQPSAFECPICKKAVTRPHTLKLHMQTHLPEDEKIHKCDECDQCFSYVGSLINHKESHHIPVAERKLYNCHICGREYTIKTSLINHMRTHRASAKLLCSECGKTLQSKSDMKNHMLIHHDKTGKNNVQCKHCGFICKNLYYLKQHEKRHTGVKFTCDKCPYITHRKQQLKQHIRVKHTDEKPFVCAICGKGFRLRSVLNHHMAQHTGEAKYSCSFCTRTFISSGNCYSHRKRMHAEEYKREKSRKLNERFRVIETNTADERADTENVHQLAREYLNKVSKHSVSKAPS